MNKMIILLGVIALVLAFAVSADAAPESAKNAFSITSVKSWGEMIIDTEDPFEIDYNMSSIKIDIGEKSLTIDGRFWVTPNTSGNITIPAGNKYLGFSFNATLSDGDIWYRDYGSQDSFIHLGPADFSYKAVTHGYDHVYYTTFASISAGTDKEFRLRFYFDEKPDSFITYFGTDSTTLVVTEGTNVEINNSYYSLIWDEDGCAVLNLWDITTNRDWVGGDASQAHARLVGNESDPLFGDGVVAHTTTVIEQSDVHARLKCGSSNDWVYVDCYADFPYCFFNYSIIETVYAQFYLPADGQEAFMLGANFTKMDTDDGSSYNQVDRGFMSTNLSTVNRSFSILFDKQSDTKYAWLSDNAGSDFLGFVGAGNVKKLNLKFNWWAGLAAYNNGNKESLNDTIMYIESTMDITNTAGSCVEQSNGTHIFDCTTNSDNALTTHIHQNNTNITNAYFKVRFYANNTNGEFKIYNSSTGIPTGDDFYVLINDTGTFNSIGASIADSNADNLTDLYVASNSVDGAVMMIGFNGDIYLTIVPEINGTLLNNCTRTSTKALTFHMLEEENRTAMNAIMEITLWLRNDGDEYEYSFKFEDNDTHHICIYPSWEEYDVDATIEYYETGYARRNYFLINATISNSTSDINLYLLSSASATDTKFIVKDVYHNLQDNVIIRAQRFYTDSNEYIAIAMGRTGFDGASGIPLKHNTWYRYILERDYEVLRIFNPMYLTEAELELYLTVKESVEYFEYYQSVAYSCRYNNDTLYLVCSVSDTSGKMVEVVLMVEERKPVGTWENVCLNSSISSSTTLTCDLSGHQNKTLQYALRGRFCCSQETYFALATGTLDLSAAAILSFGIIGVLMAFFLVITMGFAGIWNPAVGIIFMILALFVSIYLGLITGTPEIYTSFIALTVAASLIVYKLKV